MSFCIQAGFPRITGIRDPEDETLCEAAETSFISYSEEVYFTWHSIPVSLSYKYDIAVMSDDLVAMLLALRENRSGRLTINWPSNTFACRWSLDWSNRELSVQADWRSVVGGTESLLSASGPVAMPTDSFRAEWKLPLLRLIDGLERSGYTEQNLSALGGLKSEVDAIPHFGMLYDDWAIR